MLVTGYTAPLVGDIVLTRKKRGIISKLVRRFQTTSSDINNTIFEHVGMFINNGQIIEAKATVEINLFFETYPLRKYDYLIARRVDINPIERSHLRERSLNYHKRKYGVLKIVTHFLDYVLSKRSGKDRYFFRRLARNDNYPICSWLVAWVFFAEKGIMFNDVPRSLCQPDDISDDILLTNHDKYKLIQATPGIRKIILQHPTAYPDEVIESIKYGQCG